MMETRFHAGGPNRAWAKLNLHILVFQPRFGAFSASRQAVRA